MKQIGRNRYSLMEPSSQIDEATGELYPDVLSIDYTTFAFSSLPSVIALSREQLQRPFTIPKERYTNAYGEDILLDLNLVPHIAYLKVNDPLYVPAYNDFKSFVSQKVGSASSKSAARGRRRL